MTTEVERKQYQQASAARVRIFRRSLGHKTAASFARAIGYPPAKYRRYEKQGFDQSGPLIRFARAVERAGLGPLNLDWLVCGDLAGFPPIVMDRKARESEFLALFDRAEVYELPSLKRLLIRMSNGVPAEKAGPLFRQEVTLARAKAAGERAGHDAA